MSEPRGTFSNRLGFIAAAAGSAIGLGNIWKFPYEVGENGGAAFLVIYLLFAFLICMPIMVGEISMGRNTRSNPYGAFKKLGNKNWAIVGFSGVLIGVFILSFYNVVAGWAFGYFLQISFGDLLQQSDYSAYFSNYVANVGDNLIFSLAFMILTALIVIAGVKKGIERWTKILMPLLIALIVGLIIYGITLPNASQGLEFYLVPDFSKVTANTYYMALSQAFFSLSLGMGAIITYGSYISKNDNIITSAALVTTADALIAFMAGLMIFPLVFFQGIEPAEGPGLVFVSLPAIFEAMGPTLGPVIGGSFFLLLCFAALTSTVSLLEVPTAFLTDETSWSRKKSVIGLAAVIFVLGLPSMLGQGAVSWLTEFVSYGGETHSFMGVVIDVFSDVGLPLGGFLISIFVAYKWKVQRAADEIEKGNQKFRGSLSEKFFNIVISYVSPVVVGLMVIVILLNKFVGLDLLGGL
jgi:NSS family neurotransmitter:Na+ symporter